MFIGVNRFMIVPSHGPKAFENNSYTKTIYNELNMNEIYFTIYEMTSY